MRRRLLLFLTAFSFISFLARANAGEEGYSRMARLSYLEGDVFFQHASDKDWSAAGINFPLQPGDRIYTGREGRAEIEFDDGSVCRLAENTDIELLSLREDLVQWRIFAGLATLTASSSLEFEINTPAAAFNTLRSGSYRFDVVEDGSTDAIVRRGELLAANNRFSRRVEPGELLHIEPGENGYDRISRYDRRDQWDDWNDRRDAAKNATSGAGYIPSNVAMGVSELGRYGRWITVDSYGPAWIPMHVDISWSPYSIGRWSYRPRWGWTWVSHEPWGWLPYHYGRWFHHSRHGWCWIPGPAFAFNFWSPGLVAFYTGPGWVSWCPLGPGDYYNITHYYYNRAIYQHQLAGLRGLHTRAPGDCLNIRARNAFRTVEIDLFRNGSYGDRNRNSIWTNLDQPWRRGSHVGERLNIQPVAASRGTDATRQAFSPPRTNSSLPAIVRSIPIVTGSNAGINQNRYAIITNSVIRSANRRQEAPPANTGARNRQNPAVQRDRSAEGPQEHIESRSRQNPSTGGPQRPEAPARTSENRQNGRQGSQGNQIDGAPRGSSNRANSYAIPRQTAPMRQNLSPMRQPAPQMRQATPSVRMSGSTPLERGTGNAAQAIGRPDAGSSRGRAERR